MVKLARKRGSELVLILTLKTPQLRLQDFGIQIPLLSERYTNTLNAIQDDPRFAGREDEWLISAAPLPFTREQLLRVHTRDYIEALLANDPIAVLGDVFEFIDSDGQFNDRYRADPSNQPMHVLVEQRLAHAAGTLLTCEAALRKQFCYFLGGGAHHAMSHGGRGFCVVNDIVISVRELQAQQAVSNVWIIDLDAHKGDGTAELTIADPSILTLSVHMAKGWPLDEESPLEPSGHLKKCFWPSTVDVPVPEGAEDHYLELLKHGLHQLHVLSGGVRPDLAIVVDGSDPYEKDVLKSAQGLRLSLEQCIERTHLVYQWLKEQGIAQAYVMAGGYGPDNWQVHAGFLKKALPDALSSRKSVSDQIR